MEILSIGDKIKRARIYKELTLKELCGDEISVSKMSCVENGKIKAEPKILEYVCEKLNLDINYLMKDIDEQITENIEKLKSEKTNKDKDYEKDIIYNLEVAEENELFDLAFDLMHLLVEYYLEENKFENLKVEITKYYQITSKSTKKENQLVYYNDMATYFYKNKEFAQAATFYKNVRDEIIDKKIHEVELLTKVTYSEAHCYFLLKKFQKAFEIAIYLVDMVDNISDKMMQGKMFTLLALLALKLGRGSFEDYEKRVYELYEEYPLETAKAIYSFGEVMLEMNQVVKGKEYLKEALEVIPKEDKREVVNYMLLCIEQFLKNDIIDDTQKICDEVLDLSIRLNDLKYIEKAYYFKSILLQKLGDYVRAEVYMTFALDTLLKYGTKSEIYKRYLDVAYLYYKLDDIKESIDYFTLAMNMEKKM